MARIVYSFSPDQVPAPTSLKDVERDLFQDRDIRNERRVARMRPGAQATTKSHEAYLEELEAKLS